MVITCFETFGGRNMDALRHAYVSVKLKLQHAPPGQPPGHLTFSKIIVQIPPYPGQNTVQMPHTRVHSGDQMPPPRGHFTGTKMTEGRRKCLRIQLSSKVFTTNKSLVQTAEVAATRSLNAQLFFVMQHTKRSIKKDSTY